MQQSVAQLAEAKKSKPAIVQAPRVQTAQAVAVIVQRPVAQLPWRHHTILLDRLSAPEIRLWYAGKAVEHGWSGEVLALQIEAGLHKRQGKAVTNFKATLPPVQSDLAQSITKGEVVLSSRLRAALERLNPTLPPEAIAAAIDQPEIVRSGCSNRPG